MQQNKRKSFINKHRYSGTNQFFPDRNQYLDPIKNDLFPKYVTQNSSRKLKHFPSLWFFFLSLSLLYILISGMQTNSDACKKFCEAADKKGPFSERAIKYKRVNSSPVSIITAWLFTIHKGSEAKWILSDNRYQ